MQNQGAGGLSTVELLQVLIGSGTAGASSARIAQQLYAVVSGSAKNNPTFVQLKSVSGIGTAKACTVMAALELGQRLKMDSERS